MRLRCIAIAVIILASMAMVCSAQQANYNGTAKLVLKLQDMPEMPPMPDNPAKTGGLVPTTFGYPVIVQNGSTSAFNAIEAPQAPPVPQGTLLQATVLYSEDPSIKVNDTYALMLSYDPENMPYGLKERLLDDMVPGAIVGVDDYTLDGNEIKVDVGMPYWQRKIFIEGSGEAPSVGPRNPFRIDLSFKQFPAFSPFLPDDYMPPATVPSLNMSWHPAFPDIFGSFFS